jgi:hypothetical protein
VEGAQTRPFQALHLAQGTLGVDGKTGKFCAALMTHQAVGDGEVMAYLLDNISAYPHIDVVGGGGGMTPDHATRPLPRGHCRARAATPSDPATRWCGALVEANVLRGVARRRDWHHRPKQPAGVEGELGYHQHWLAETLNYRLKVLTAGTWWRTRLAPGQPR